MNHTRKITKKTKKQKNPKQTKPVVGGPTRAANVSAYLASLPNNHECPLVASTTS